MTCWFSLFLPRCDVPHTHGGRRPSNTACTYTVGERRTSSAGRNRMETETTVYLIRQKSGVGVRRTVQRHTVACENNGLTKCEIKKKKFRSSGWFWVRVFRVKKYFTVQCPIDAPRHPCEFAHAVRVYAGFNDIFASD